MSEVTVHFHAQWEAELVLRLLNARIPGVNVAEAQHAAGHIARAIDPDGWRALVNDPEA